MSARHQEARNGWRQAEFLRQGLGCCFVAFNLLPAVIHEGLLFFVVAPGLCLFTLIRQRIRELALVDAFHARQGARSSIGMALLATRSDDEIRAGYAGNAILDYPDGIDSLLAAIGRIRRQGFARVIESETRSTVAVTIGTPAEAAIALAGPVTDSQLKRLVKQLQAAAQAIEEGTRH